MTKSEFKQDLLRGLGRCVQAVQLSPERYRECVLWACSHEIAYDPECEGSRAYYVYDMVACYPEREPFAAATVEALKKAKVGSWKLSYLAELPDAEAVFSALRSGVTDPDELHGLVMELFDLEDAGVKVPAELLLQAYESGYCSCCRETTVRILARRRLLTEDILHECLYDSDDEIRAYARRLLARRHQ